MTKLTSSDLLELIMSFLPISIRTAKRGVGSFLTFDMGEEVMDLAVDGEKGIRKGEKIHLWIYLCDWEIFQRDELLLNSIEEDDQIYNRVGKSLIQQKLVRIEKILNVDSFRFVFTNDYQLLLRSNTNVYAEEDELFMVFIDGYSSIVYSPLKGFYWGE
jgi:hypothetical protein